MRTARGGRYVSVVAMAATIAGCAIGPDYERPTSVASPDSFRAINAIRTEKSLADVAWAEVFGDPELVPVIARALANNLDLQSAVARVEQFRAQRNIARSAFGPQIRSTVSTSPNPAGENDAEYAAGFTVSWELDLFGKLRRADEAARAQLMSAEDNARAVMSSLVAAVASTWFQLRELDEEVAIVRNNVASQEESLALVRSLLRNGVASAAEEQQALGQLATTRTQLPLTLQRRMQAENSLQFLLGNPPDVIERTASPSFASIPEALPVGLPARLLERRPDVRALENTLRASTAQIGVAQASRFPYLSIGLTTFFGLVSTDLSRLLDGGDRAQNVDAIGPVADLPVFQSGRGTANVDSARAAQRQAELAYRAGVLQALREVADALTAADLVREVITQNEVRSDAAATTLRLQRMRYRAGVVSYIEVLDAERQLFTAQLDLAQAKLSQQQSYIDLYRALGGGWSDVDLARLKSP